MLSLALKGKLHFNQPAKKWVWFALALLVLCLDQITKYWATANLHYGDSVGFLPYFNFTLLYNYGAAFSFLADQSGWQRIMLSVVAFVISVFLVFWILCIHSEKKIEIAGLSLILGGAMGNLWDRVQLGYVVDFIDWFYPTATSNCLSFFYPVFSTNTCHWPAFNIADSAIFLGVVFLLADMFLGEKSS